MSPRCSGQARENRYRTLHCAAGPKNWYHAPIFRAPERWALNTVLIVNTWTITTLGSLNNNSPTLGILLNNKAFWGLWRPQMTLFGKSRPGTVGFWLRLVHKRASCNKTISHQTSSFVSRPSKKLGLCAARRRERNFSRKPTFWPNLGLNNSWTTLTNNKGHEQ